MNLQGLVARCRQFYLVDLIWRAWERFSRTNGAIHAAAISYSTLLALFPLLIVFVALFGLLTARPRLGPWLTRIAADHAPGTNLERLLEEVTGTQVSVNAAVGLVGLAILVMSASGMFGTLRLTLNRAFGIARRPEFVHARAQDLAGVIALFVLALLIIGLSVALSALRDLTGRQFAGQPATLAWGIVARALPYAASTLAFLLLYRLIPSRALPVRDLWPAALLAGAGFQLAEVGFGIYLDHFAAYEVVYGALAGAVALLVFLYFEANIILFAAGLAAELARDRQLGSEPSPVKARRDGNLPG